MASSNEKAMGAVAHVAPILGLGLLGWLVAFGILITQKDKSPFVTRHAIQSLTFQFVLFLWTVACVILSFVPFVGFIGSILAMVGGLAGIILPVIGAIHSARGEDFSYPVVGRFYNRSIS